MSQREIYLEYRRNGNAIKVVAIDSKTAIEACTFGPLNASKEELGRIAVRKLQMRLAREGN